MAFYYTVFGLATLTEFCVFLYYSLQKSVHTAHIHIFFHDLHIYGWKHHLLASAHWNMSSKQLQFLYLSTETPDTSLPNVYYRKWHISVNARAIAQ